MKLRLVITTFLCVFVAQIEVVYADSFFPAEKTVHYAIHGQTPIDLYHSIGEQGPKAGNGRAIAVTDFELKWSRRYMPEGRGCRLTVAKPHLTISYKMPKPSKKLSPEVAARWEIFIQGVELHERVHGEMIVETVGKIRAATLGLYMENDPDCKKLRREVDQITKPLVSAHQKRSRDFDKVELSTGGTVHQLVLALING